MKTACLAVAFFVLALVVRLGHIADNQALSYRANPSTTVAISFTTILFWLLLVLAGLLAVVALLVRVRMGNA